MIQRNQQSYVESLEGRQLLSAAWGTQAKLIGQDLVAQQFPQLTGSGQTVAVIDSGVDYNHPALGGGWGKKVIAGWDFASNDSDPMSSSNAHGTGTASMIAATPYDYKGYHYSGIAPGVKLIALRESNSTGVMNAFKWVIANKVKYNITAVNFTDFGGGNKTTGNSIKASLATLNSMGVYMTAPSGNSGSKGGVPGYSVEETVGSVTKSDTISGFTNRGPGLDFLAPGDKIAVPYYDVGSKKHIYVDSGVGTSWSAPQIAGAAVLLRQINPRFTNAQITSILQQTGAQKYDSATHRSYARLNLYGAVRLALQLSGKKVPPPVTPGVPNPPSGPDDNVPTPVPPADPQAPGGAFVSTRTKIGTATTVIQVENFDSGAEGTAYHDTDKVNKGGNNYRPGTGVDIMALGGKATNRGVGIVKAGEWLKYSVAVQTAGSYNVSFNVAALGSGGAFHLEVDGKNVTGTVNVTDTKSWTKYTSVSKNGINLAAGNHTLRLVFDKNGKTGYVGNFDAITITKGVSRSVPSTPTTPTPTPKPPAIPASFNLAAGSSTTIQAEDFAAYRDVTSKNEGGQYRTNTGVDIEKTTDTGGGYDVGFMKATEWLSYAVNVTKAGTFNLDARVASQYAGGAFHVEVDGKNVTGTMKFTNTGGFQKWTTLRKAGVKLAAGKHTIKLVVDSTGGHPFAGNVNWIKFS